MFFSHRTMNRLSDVFFTTDIHGQHRLLKESLHQAGFNPKKGHVLVSCGDLVDVGPENECVLSLLKNDWFISTCGNHDLMMLNATRELSQKQFLRIQSFMTNENGYARLFRCFREGESSELEMEKIQQIMNDNQAHWLLNGGKWFFARGKQWEEQMQYQQLLVDKKLPLALELSFPDCRIGVVHAETSRQDWDLTRSQAERGRSGSLLWSRHHVKQCLSNKIDSAQQGQVAGIDAVIFGHTIMPQGQYRQFGNSFYLDCGAKNGCHPNVVRADTLMQRLNKKEHLSTD